MVTGSTWLFKIKRKDKDRGKTQPCKQIERVIERVIAGKAF